MAAKICLKPLGQEEVPKLLNVLKGFLPDSIVVKNNTHWRIYLYTSIVNFTVAFRPGILLIYFKRQFNPEKFSVRWGDVPPFPIENPQNILSTHFFNPCLRMI
jgi:hypothetical protein